MSVVCEICRTMFSFCCVIFWVSLYVSQVFGEVKKYEPNWESLDSRPIPSWYDDTKIGIFIHWGVHSVPSYSSTWFGYYLHYKNKDIVSFMQKNYRPGITYQDLASHFTAEFFDPVKWAKLFEEAGAEYVVLDSQFHDGYALWPSKYSVNWNSVDVGPHKDLVGELANAVRKETKLRFGLHNSFLHWFHPLYELDKSNNFRTQDYVLTKVFPQMQELVRLYKPDIVWANGDWDADDTYWKSKEYLVWLYNDSPVKDTVVVNDRWGSNAKCKHGGFLTCGEHYNPGILKERKWENTLSIDVKSWGYRRNANLNDYLTLHDIIKLLAQAASCNGNILIHVGPTKDGIITPIEQERLLGLGKWLKVNGAAIYKSKPWTVCQKDSIASDVWYTTQKSETDGIDLYAIVLSWPTQGVLTLKCPLVSSSTKIKMLGVSNPLKWTNTSGLLNVEFPDQSMTSADWAWTLKITNLNNVNNKVHRNNVF